MTNCLLHKTDDGKMIAIVLHLKQNDCKFKPQCIIFPSLASSFVILPSALAKKYCKFNPQSSPKTRSNRCAPQEKIMPALLFEDYGSDFEKFAQTKET